jgi:hypothetical protein
MHLRSFIGQRVRALTIDAVSPIENHMISNRFNFSSPEDSVRSGDVPLVPLWSKRLKPRKVNIWERYSPKAKRNVRLYGNLKYYLWILLESDPTFTSLCEQPLRIRAKLADGRWAASIFDFWCRDAEGTDYFFQIEYVQKIICAQPESRLARNLSAQLVWAQQNNVRYAVATDRTVWAHPVLLTNWSTILSFLAQFRDACLHELGKRIVRAVGENEQMALGTIVQEFSPVSPEEVRAALFVELHAGRLSGDLNSTRLGAKTIFRIPHA